MRRRLASRVSTVVIGSSPVHTGVIASPAVSIAVLAVKKPKAWWRQTSETTLRSSTSAATPPPRNAGNCVVLADTDDVTQLLVDDNRPTATTYLALLSPVTLNLAVACTGFRNRGSLNFESPFLSPS